MCTHTCLLYSFPLVLFGDALLLLSSCRREGVHPELPGVRGLLGGHLLVDVPVVPSFREASFMFYASAYSVSDIFVINVINNICIRFDISFYVICAVIYCSFCCIYVWLDPGTYMIARFMSFYKPGVTCMRRARYGSRVYTPVNTRHTPWDTKLMFYLWASRPYCHASVCTCVHQAQVILSSSFYLKSS